MAYTLKTKIANKSNYGNRRSLSDIKYIVIHYTSNDGDTDENNGKYYANTVVKASAHYFIDDDSITQSVPDNYVAWSVGGKKYNNCSTTGGGKLHGIATNANTLSIEICDDVKNGVVYPSQETIENVIAFTKIKMKEYNIPASNVIRHFDVTGKSCPAYWVDNTKWKNEFWNKLSTSTSTSSIPTVQVPFSITVNNVKKNDVLNIRKEPNADSAKTGQLAYNDKNTYTIIEVKNGWGRLKSKIGWINLSYTKTVTTTSKPIATTPTPTPVIKPVVQPVQKPVASTPKPEGNPIVKKGQQHAINFTGVKIDVDGFVGNDTNKMKKRVLQHALNLDYGNTLKEDGLFQTKSKLKLGSHYVKKGEKQYMVTAAEILMELHGIDPNGVEMPGKYGNGLVKAAKKFFGDDGTKITASEFLRLIQ